MPPFDIVIGNGQVVTASDIVRCDVGIRSGKVAALGLDLGPAAQVIDASGKLILPGGVDSHCHIEQPSSGGAENADTFETGTTSAACGGTTTVICFAKQPKGQSLVPVVADYHQKAKKSLIDYSFHLIVTDPSDTVVREELPDLIDQGHRSLKIFTTYDGSALNDAEILRVFAVARRKQALVTVHAENDAAIRWMTQALIDAGMTNLKYHAWAKPMVVEREAVQRVIALAELVDVPIQIFHVSGRDSAEEIQRAQARGLKVFAETCPQYLVLTARDLDRPGFEGAKYSFSPPARTEADQEALWGFLASGVLGVVSSDHSPNRYDDPKGKMLHGNNAPFNIVPSGVPGLETRLPVVFSEGVVKRHLSLTSFVALTSTNPAKLFGLYPQKGTIAVGSDADIAIWDPAERTRITNEMLHHAVDYTPYEGMEVQGWPTTTILRGKIVWDGTSVLGKPGDGHFLPRAPYDLVRPLDRFVTPFNPADGRLFGA